MSLNALNYAKHVEGLPPLAKLVFIFFGDAADDFGDAIFPSLDWLERKTGILRKRLKRVLKWLIDHEWVIVVAQATPVSPAFYRMVGVPDPDKLTPSKRAASCPAPLRRAVIYSFARRCEVCGRHGLGDLGPDGRPWEILRIDPDKPAGFVPENVTLSCATCARRKQLQTGSFRSLCARQQDPEQRGQIDPSDDREQAGLFDPSFGPLGGVTTTPWEGSKRGGGGVNLTPDLLKEPSGTPCTKSRGSAPDEDRAETETGSESTLPVVTKIAHEVLDLLGQKASYADVSDAVSELCARRKILYHRPPDLVRKAIESAQWQRQHRSSSS